MVTFRGIKSSFACLGFILLLWGSACQSQAIQLEDARIVPAPETTPVLEITATQVAQITPEPPPPLLETRPADQVSYTYQRADGNRLVAGQGELPALQPTKGLARISLSSMPLNPLIDSYMANEQVAVRCRPGPVLAPVARTGPGLRLPAM